MNTFCKKNRKAVLRSLQILLLISLFIPMLNSICGLKVYAATETGGQVNIRGFELPAEQIQPITVKAAELKTQLNIDYFQLAYIVLIIIGVIFLILLIFNWAKSSKKVKI